VGSGLVAIALGIWMPLLWLRQPAHENDTPNTRPSP
jgi:hypothetical protein